MMEKPYSLCRPILLDVKYEIADLTLLFRNEAIGQQVGLAVNVSRMDNGTNEYMVHIIADVTESSKECAGLNMMLTFVVFARMNSSGISEEEVKKMLKDEVPEAAFGQIRKVVKSLSAASGFPPVDMKRENIEIEIIEKDFHIEPPLGFEWVLYNLKSTRDGAEFLKSLIEAYGTSCIEYKESPLYKYFYRFLVPIKYRHPQIDSCDDEFWALLFQLIFAECDDVDIEEGGNGLPEIIFSYEGHAPRRISGLSTEELKKITSELAVTAFTGTMVSLFATDFNEGYGDTLPDNTPLLEREVHKLYNFNPESMEEEGIEFINRVCSRIRRYADLTFQYHLLNE